MTFVYKRWNVHFQRAYFLEYFHFSCQFESEWIFSFWDSLEIHELFVWGLFLKLLFNFRTFFSTSRFQGKLEKIFITSSKMTSCIQIKWKIRISLQFAYIWMYCVLVYSKINIMILFLESSFRKFIFCEKNQLTLDWKFLINFKHITFI